MKIILIIKESTSGGKLRNEIRQEEEKLRLEKARQVFISFFLLHEKKCLLKNNCLYCIG